MSAVVNVDDARRLARRRLPRPIFDFVDGGAEDELTVAANRAAFRRVWLEPQYLRDTPLPSLTTSVLGTEIALPVMLAPVGQQRMLTRDGELASARAAGEAGALLALSGAATRSLEEVAAVATGPLWGQVSPGPPTPQMERYFERAAAAGVLALTIGVDGPVLGNRERDRRNRVVIPPQRDLRSWGWALTHPGWFRDVLMAPPIVPPELPGEGGKGAPTIVGGQLTERLGGRETQWSNLGRIRELWKGPLVLKGITSQEDARRAVGLGVEGIIVSNHGGRMLDGAPPTFEALPGVIAATQGTGVEVYLDGGVRRGSDVVKALALGARACLIGRPYVFGLGAAGEAGVAAVLEIFRSEIERVLRYLGVASVRDIDARVLRAPAGGVPLQRVAADDGEAVPVS